MAALLRVEIEARVLPIPAYHPFSGRGVEVPSFLPNGAEEGLVVLERFRNLACGVGHGKEAGPPGALGEGLREHDLLGPLGKEALDRRLRRIVEGMTTVVCRVPLQFKFSGGPGCGAG